MRVFRAPALRKTRRIGDWVNVHSTRRVRPARRAPSPTQAACIRGPLERKRPADAGRRAWRRARDSNPGALAGCRFSRPVQSTTLPFLRGKGSNSLKTDNTSIAFFFHSASIFQEKFKKNLQLKKSYPTPKSYLLYLQLFLLLAMLLVVIEKIVQKSHFFLNSALIFH